MKTILAIDPGVSGGIAIICGANVSALPFKDNASFVVFVQGLQQEPTNQIIAYMELVGGFIKGKEDAQPGSAMFTFGSNYGFYLGALAMAGIKLELVRPQVWQKIFSRLSCKGAERKRAIKEAVAAWYPELKVTLATCDALGLLRYAMAAENAGPKPAIVAKVKKPALPVDKAALVAQTRSDAQDRIDSLPYKEQSALAIEWCKLNLYEIPKRKTPEFSTMFNYWYNLAINGDA